MSRPEKNILPLTFHAYYILLALSNRPLHAYGLAQQVAMDSDCVVKISGGTLHNLLIRLTSLALIEQGPAILSERSQHLRKPYHLTDLGRGILYSETTRWAHAVELSQKRQGNST